MRRWICKRLRPGIDYSPIRCAGWGSTVQKRARSSICCRRNSALAERIVPDLPYIMAEVVYACRYEMVVALEDVLVRRLHINFEDWGHGVEVAPAVAGRMARELGWDEAEAARQVADYRRSGKF